MPRKENTTVVGTSVLKSVDNLLKWNIEAEYRKRHLSNRKKSKAELIEDSLLLYSYIMAVSYTHLTLPTILLV